MIRCEEGGAARSFAGFGGCTRRTPAQCGWRQGGMGGSSAVVGPHPPTGETVKRRINKTSQGRKQQTTI